MTPPRPSRLSAIALVVLALTAMSAVVRAAEPGSSVVPAGFVKIAEDNGGTPKAQPHLISGENWTFTDEERKGSDVADPKLLSFTYGDSVAYRYVGLRPDAKYSIVVTSFNLIQNRRQDVLVNGRSLEAPYDLPIGKTTVRCVTLPPGSYSTGKTTIAFCKVSGFSALVSVLELWSDQAGLLGKPRALMRLRIDAPPPSGPFYLTAGLKIHQAPWAVANVALKPLQPAPNLYKAVGFTPWFDLSQIPHFGGVCSLLLNIAPGAKGAVEFAMYPRDDAVARTIDWNSPDGTRFSLTGDVDGVMTFRDQERANYHLALNQLGERMFPLTRPPLLFSNAWGYTTGGAAEYMVKSFRLMGFNSVVTSADAAKYEKYYGWGSQAGEYSPPGFMPYDEAMARAMYDKNYVGYFAKNALSPGVRTFQVADEPGEAALKDKPKADAAFRLWLQSRGVTPEQVGEKNWDEVVLTWAAGDTADSHRNYYWSRIYKGEMTPHMYALACEAIRKNAPNHDVRAYVALSGHALYMNDSMPMNMFALGSYADMTPGISDHMTSGSWFWDSHQSVAYSVAPFLSGARRYGADFGKPPITFPMMHCVAPSLFRAFTQLANQCKLISYYNYGPSYEVTECYWSGNGWSTFVTGHVDNMAAQVDDILGPGVMRPSNVAMLYSQANEVWFPKSSFADKRASFLALSHEYFQPELLTDEQARTGALAHYKAIYVLDSFIPRATQDAIMTWVKGGGLLWLCADAMVRDEASEPYDAPMLEAGLKRTFGKPGENGLRITPVEGETSFVEHSVPPNGRPSAVEWEGASVRAKYGDGVPAWLEKNVGKGEIVYIGHRAGLSYSRRAGKLRDMSIWPDTGRRLLTQPLYDAKVERELVLSQPLVMATPLSTPKGTVITLYNMTPNPIVDLRITLREPTAPVSVQCFNEKCELVDLPFKFDSGSLLITLHDLPWSGQMIVVRREAAPPDDRIEQMRKTAEAGIASSDWQARSAGAWFAGFYPRWSMGDALMPLLKDANWAVRRSAAESLGRLHYAAAAAPLRAMVDAEADAHALADGVIALGKLKYPDLPAVCAKLDRYPDPIVQQASHQAASLAGKQLP